MDVHNETIEFVFSYDSVNYQGLGLCYYLQPSDMQKHR